MQSWAKVYRTNPLLLIPAVLNQMQRRLFVLDSGAFTTSISPEAAREVSKVHADHSLTIKGISGKVEKVYSADKIMFDFANLRQTAGQVVAFDTSSISKGYGLEVVETYRNHDAGATDSQHRLSGCAG